MPTSILVLPASNETTRIEAPYVWLSTITRPLAERGYYVFPVAVVDEVMKENGVTSPAEMASLPPQKLHEVFGADAILYATIERWGQVYEILQSTTHVAFRARLVDARTGTELWIGQVRESRGSDQAGNQNGLAELLIGAVIDQIAGTLVDRTRDLSGHANRKLISSDYDGLLPGPYRPAADGQAPAGAYP